MIYSSTFVVFQRLLLIPFVDAHLGGTAAPAANRAYQWLSRSLAEVCALLSQSFARLCKLTLKQSAIWRDSGAMRMIALVDFAVQFTARWSTTFRPIGLQMRISNVAIVRLHSLQR